MVALQEKQPRQSGGSKNGAAIDTGARQFVTLYLGNRYFGVDVLKVQEVIRQQPMTRVPLSDKVIRGLINLRGQIVLALDLRCRLGMDLRQPDEECMNLVVQTPDGPVSLLVDEIGDVIEVNSQIYEHSPDMLRGVQRELIDGVYKLKDKLLIALNVDKVVHVNDGAI
jgi:purine-binding chemotaxis protein CheW